MTDPGTALNRLVDKMEDSSDIWINFKDGSKAVLYHESGDWMLEGDRFLRASGTRLTITDGQDIEIALESSHSPIVARFKFPASDVNTVYKCTDIEGMMAVYAA